MNWRRHSLLQNLLRRRDDPSFCYVTVADDLFRLLYGLPVHVQLGLSRSMILRYFDIFETRHPGVVDHQFLFQSIEDWPTHDDIGSLLDWPDDWHVADRSFVGSIWGLLFAVKHADHPASLTSSCLNAISDYIDARGLIVWSADDPIGLRRIQDREVKSIKPNACDLAVNRRETIVVVNWLSENEISKHPNEVDVGQMERYLQRWNIREGTYSSPEAFESEEPFPGVYPLSGPPLPGRRRRVSTTDDADQS